MGNIFVLILALVLKYSMEGISINYFSDYATTGKWASAKYNPDLSILKFLEKGGTVIFALYS